MATVANVHSSKTVEVNDPLVAPEGKRVVEFTRMYYDGFDGLPEYVTKQYHLVRYSTIAGSKAINYTFQRIEDIPAPRENVSDRRISGEGPELKPHVSLTSLIPTPEPEWFIEYRRRQLVEAGRLNGENIKLRQQVQALESAILEHKQEQRKVTAMSIYGSENALEEMTRQVSIAPQFKDLTPDEHRFVAGVGLMSGLNPVFHLHAWKQKKWNPETKQNEQTLHILPHYTALIASSPDPIMTESRRLSPEEMRARGIPERDILEGSIAYEVKGYNLKHAIMARRAGLTYTPMIGFGWWAAMKDDDDWQKGSDGKNHKVGTKRVPNEVPNGRDGEWRAKTRAERDLYNHTADLRPRFVAPDGGHVIDDEWVMGEIEEPKPDVINGEFTVTDTSPAQRPDWLTPEGETRANAYMLKMCVTDEMVNTALSVKNWRETPITADEFKVVVDHEAPPMMTVEPPPADVIDGEIVTIEPAPVASTETAENKPLPELVTAQETAAAAQCDSCGLEDADPTGPFPTLCKTCGNAEANRQAAKTEKASAKK